MSYEKVRRIEVDDEKVFLTSTSNNVYPYHYERYECPSLSKILQEQGEKALTVELLKCYEEGNFQPGVENKYSRAAKRLRRMEEYKAFDWRLGKSPTENSERRENNEKEFQALLYRAFLMKEDKSQQCLVSKDYSGEEVFIKRVNKWNITFTRTREKAKKFGNADDARRIINALVSKEHFNIIHSAR